MRPKRQKPSKTSGKTSGNAGRRRFPKREFGRQIDADLTDEPDQTDSRSAAAYEDSAGFAGAEFPEIDPDEQSSALTEAPVVTQAIVRERAMRLLVHREHGRKELEKKLLQRELPQDLIVSVLDQLAEEGLQCDIRFAESYTRMRVDRGFGANKVRADLQVRHLEHSIIEDAIRDSDADWTELASIALFNKFEGKKFDSKDSGGKSVASAKTRARMQRFLYQRGFEAEQIRSAMNDFETAHA